MTIPKEYLKELNLRDGSPVVVEKSGDRLIVSRAEKKAAGVDAKFMKMVDEFINEHRDVLKELAKK